MEFFAYALEPEHMKKPSVAHAAEGLETELMDGRLPSGDCQSLPPSTTMSSGSTSEPYTGFRVSS